MRPITADVKNESKINQIEMIEFYNEATKDYEFWSRDFNMHFGFFIPFKTNPFRRDSMLNEMNKQVLDRLEIGRGKKSLVDLGCGMGASMRYALKQNKKLSACGVTLSKFQVDKGNELLKDTRGLITQENYNKTAFKPNNFDAALAIESFCHSGHSTISLKEAQRILNPGGTLVIADAFLKKDVRRLGISSRAAYKNLCEHWSLERLEDIITYASKLRAVGFKNLKIENISFRVAPSVLHVPFAISGFVLKKLIRKQALKRESLHNLKGSFYALSSGLHIKSFGYYIITATK